MEQALRPVLWSCGAVAAAIVAGDALAWAVATTLGGGALEPPASVCGRTPCLEQVLATMRRGAD